MRELLTDLKGRYEYAYNAGYIVELRYPEAEAILAALIAAQEYADADRVLKVICEANSAAYRECGYVGEEAQEREEVAETRWVKARDAFAAAFPEEEHRD